MKTITPHLLRFALTATVLTVAYRYFLSYGIENHSGVIIALSATIYGLLMFASGWYFGRNEDEYLPIYDVGFRFHLTTYTIHNGISVLWILLGFGSKLETLNLSIMVSIYWGIVLLLHFIFFLRARKKAIDYLDKEDIFE